MIHQFLCLSDRRTCNAVKSLHRRKRTHNWQPMKRHPARPENTCLNSGTNLRCLSLLLLIGLMLTWLHFMFSRETEVSYRFHEACYLVPFKVKFKRDYGEICQEKIQSFRLSSAQSFLPKNFLFSARLLTILSQARAFFGVISIYCIFEI